MEPLTLSMRVKVKKTNNLDIQSVGFFGTISWTLTRRYESVYWEEVVHVAIFTFS